MKYRLIFSIMNGYRTLKIGQLLLRVGSSAIGIVSALLSTFRDLFASAEIKRNDNRRLHDSDLIGEMNYRTGRLDSGTDPYGWYDDD